MDKQFLIRDLPPETDRTLNTLATVRGIAKWIVIRDALIEYANKHRRDIAAAAKKVD